MKPLPTIVSAERLSAGYENVTIWSDANFSIHRGEFVGILGPNGAGKTTLFRMLLGLKNPITGTISFFDGRPKKGDRRVGYVPQRHPIDTDTNIEALELVHLGLSGHRFGFGRSRKENEEAVEALRIVGAEHLAHRPLGMLSGGELQRIFLAEALAGKPDILLLDEPLSNLDIRRETGLVALIKKISVEHKVTVLLIAHNINPLLSALDTVMYIANGKIVTGSPEEIISSKILSDIYDTNVEVLRDSRGRLAIIGAEEETHHHTHHE